MLRPELLPEDIRKEYASLHEDSEEITTLFEYQAEFLIPFLMGIIIS